MRRRTRGTRRDSGGGQKKKTKKRKRKSGDGGRGEMGWGSPKKATIAVPARHRRRALLPPPPPPPPFVPRFRRHSFFVFFSPRVSLDAFCFYFFFFRFFFFCFPRFVCSSMRAFPLFFRPMCPSRSGRNFFFLFRVCVWPWCGGPYTSHGCYGASRTPVPGSSRILFFTTSVLLSCIWSPLPV